MTGDCLLFQLFAKRYQELHDEEQGMVDAEGALAPASASRPVTPQPMAPAWAAVHGWSIQG